MSDAKRQLKSEFCGSVNSVKWMKIPVFLRTEDTPSFKTNTRGQQWTSNLYEQTLKLSQFVLNHPRES